MTGSMILVLFAVTSIAVLPPRLALHLIDGGYVLSLFLSIAAGLVFEPYMMADNLQMAQRNLAPGERLALLDQSYAQLAHRARQRHDDVADALHDLRQPMQTLRLGRRIPTRTSSSGGGAAGAGRKAWALAERRGLMSICLRKAAALAIERAPATGVR